MPRLLGAHSPSGIEQLHGHVVGQAARQDLHGADVGQETALQVGQEELGVVGGDDQVTGERDFETAARGHAVDRRDHGFFQSPELGDAAESARTLEGAGDGFLVVVEGGDFLQVPAGAEKSFAGPGENADLQRVVLLQSRQGLEYGLRDSGIDRVGGRAVDGDFEDSIVTFDADFGIHAGTLIMCVNPGNICQNPAAITF